MAERGVWQSGTLYATGDTVTHVGKKWESLRNNNTIEPGKDATFWREVVLPTIAALAAKALDDKAAAEVAQQEAARQAVRNEARTVLGTTLALPADVLAALPVVHLDMASRFVVFQDASLALGVALTVPINVRRYELRDGQWQPTSRPVTSLADLGAVLG